MYNIKIVENDTERDDTLSTEKWEVILQLYLYLYSNFKSTAECYTMVKSIEANEGY